MTRARGLEAGLLGFGIELPDVGRSFAQGEQFGSIESVKAVSDLFCPVSGLVAEVNVNLADAPEAVNKDAHEAWMICVKLSNPDELSALLDAEAYARLVE